MLDSMYVRDLGVKTQGSKPYRSTEHAASRDGTAYMSDGGPKHDRLPGDGTCTGGLNDRWAVGRANRHGVPMADLEMQPTVAGGLDEVANTLEA